MRRELSVVHESWPLASPFRIARGVKFAADVVVVQIREGAACGRGEAVPYARYGESIDSVLAQIRSIGAQLAAGMERDALQDALPPGAARNAVDCALWDLASRTSGRPVSARLGEGPLPPVASALTVAIDTPEAMRAAAATLGAASLIKVKVDAEDPEAQLRAVRAGAPGARLIVDPNESWTLDILQAMQPVLLETRVELVEQPLPAEQDEALEGFVPACPICADESCHIAADLPALQRRYQAVNIKLDKAGGLSEARVLLHEARARGMQVMCGCMVCTSLGIAPAFHIARHADVVDLDGPLWLAQDRPGGVRLEDGLLRPPDLWGEPA